MCRDSILFIANEAICMIFRLKNSLNQQIRFDTILSTPYYCAPMSTTSHTAVLPRLLDPRKFAQQGILISGEVDVNLLDRLLPLLANDGGNIKVDLVFGVDEQHVRNLTGTIKASLSMVCQRCLDPVTQDVELSIALGMVWSDEQAEKLSKTWEPWIVDEGQTDIYEMIQDELILGLPIVAYHPEKCLDSYVFSESTSVNKSDELKDNSASKEERPNPFQVLESLKGSLGGKPNATESDKTKH